MFKYERQAVLAGNVGTKGSLVETLGEYATTMGTPAKEDYEMLEEAVIGSGGLALQVSDLTTATQKQAYGNILHKLAIKTPTPKPAHKEAFTKLKEVFVTGAAKIEWRKLNDQYILDNGKVAYDSDRAATDQEYIKALENTSVNVEYKHLEKGAAMVSDSAVLDTIVTKTTDKNEQIKLYLVAEKAGKITDGSKTVLKALNIADTGSIDQTTFTSIADVAVDAKYKNFHGELFTAIKKHHLDEHHADKYLQHIVSKDIPLVGNTLGTWDSFQKKFGSNAQLLKKITINMLEGRTDNEFKGLAAYPTTINAGAPVTVSLNPTPGATRTSRDIRDDIYDAIDPQGQAAKVKYQKLLGIY